MRKQSKQRQRELLRVYQEEQANRIRNEQSGGGNLVAYFDGACEPKNPGGNMGVGATIRKNGVELFRHSRFIPAGPTNSNNVAEYMAMQAILQFTIDQGWTNTMMTIFGDSKLVIEQLFGTWRMKGGFYIPYANDCVKKLQHLKSRNMTITGIWIRREQNSYADELSKAELINHNVNFKIQPLTLNPNQ